MSKGPPPPIKPKPKLPPPIKGKKPDLKIGSGGSQTPVNTLPVEDNSHSVQDNLNRTPVTRSMAYTNVDPVITKPITMTALDDSDTEDDENVEINDDKLKSPLRPVNFPPPKRSANSYKTHKIDSLSSTRPQSIQNTDFSVSPVTRNLPPPPRHRSLDQHNISNANNKEIQNSRPLPVKKPAKKSTLDFSDDDEPPAPKLPARPPVRSLPSRSNGSGEEDRPSFLSPKKPSRMDSRRSPSINDENPPALPPRRDTAPQRPSVNLRDYQGHSREVSDLSEDDDEISQSSQILDKSKKHFNSGYQTVVDKSTPFAKQAKNSISKLKDKIQNSTSSLIDENADQREDDDEYYRARREKATNRSQVSRSASPELEEQVADISIDEDRPPLPQRRQTNQSINGPHPGLTQKPKPRPKPEVPKRAKPAIPSKEQEPFNIDSFQPPQRLVTPPSVTPRLAPPIAPPSRTSSPSVGIESRPPAPPPTRSRPPVAPPSRTSNKSLTPVPVWTEPELDLELPRLWFTESDLLQLPKCFKGLNCQMSAGFAGNKEFRVYAFRGKDLSTIKLKLTWKKDSASPLDSLSQELEFTPPPVATKELLIRGSDKFGEHIANWCEVKLGQQVGNGECWTLAHDALQKGCGKHAFVSTGLVHGALLYTVKASNDKPDVFLSNITDDIKRGDILQFKSCFFKYPTQTMTYGLPDHTAIVLDVKDGFSGGNLKELHIIQQNAGGVKVVQDATIDLGRLKGGDIKIYRPVEKEWIIDLMDALM